MSHPRSRKSSTTSGRRRPRQAPVQRPQTESQCLTLEIDNLTSEGQGVARRGREVYFVPGALPGETADVVLDGRRKKVWQTRLRRITQPSPDRVEPTCPHYDKCGGCDLQHLNYPAQVAAKQARVEREFQRQGIVAANWSPAITAAPWNYRRKARLGVRYSKAEERNYIGFRESASSHISDVDACPVLVQHPVLNWQAWRQQISSLRHRDRISQIEVIAADNALALVLRVLKPLSEEDQQSLCQLIERLASGSDLAVQLWLKNDQGEQCIYPSSAPETLWHQVNDMRLNMALSDFIQVNSTVNQSMVEQALEWLQPGSEDCIWDLFSGHGNFSMPLAQRSHQVIAVEVQDSMVNSVVAQAENLALPLLGKKADLSQPQSLASLPQPDAVLLDPPRAGALEVMAELIKRQVERIVYVSCDVATLARDLGRLNEAGYRVTKAGIMDMFPQTHHVETMVLLQRESNKHG